MAATSPEALQLIEMAKLADQAERYDDMSEYMKQYAEMCKVISDDNRNLLSVAFKNVVGSRRSSWRILTNDEKPNPQRDSYKDKVVAELKEICNKVLGLLDDILLPNTDEKNAECKVFYYKMKADYHRYLAEVATEKEKEDVVEKSLNAYKEAQKIAEEKMAPTQSTRLGLALNFSVFYYEIKQKPDEACKLAKSAFDAAIAELDQLKEDNYKDSTLIMQLLRDNLTLWTSDAQGDTAGDDGEN